METDRLEIVAEDLLINEEEIEEEIADIRYEILQESEDGDDWLSVVLRADTFTLYLSYTHQENLGFEECTHFELKIDQKITRFGFYQFFKFLDALSEFGELVDDDELF